MSSAHFVKFSSLLAVSLR